MALPVSPTAVALALVGVWLVYKALTFAARPKGLPPGPPTLPIVGNLHQIPKKDVHIKFKEWAEQYGDMYSLMLGSKRMVVLNSPRVVKDLLDNRSTNYSSRPDAYVGQTLISGGYRLVFMPYADEWRLARKMLHNLLNVRTAVDYIPFQELELRQMLADMIKRPDRYHDHVRRYSTSLVTSFTFGWRSLAFGDPEVKQIYEGFEQFAVASNVSASLMDYFPILRRLPDWASGIKRLGKQLHKEELDLYKTYMLKVKDRIDRGVSGKNFCEELFAYQKKHKFTDDWGSYVSGTLLEAGSDTTASIFMTFAVAMVNYPEAQKKAQEELDRVIGADRLPTMDDAPALPYIRGTVKETLRWLPSSILGIVPHATTADDEYNGYLIPAETNIMLNVWALNNDPERYPNPRKFDPARYLGDDLTAAQSAAQQDPYKRDHFTFGSGRRICQGLNIAERSLFLGYAYMLWAFNFEHAHDADGKEIPVSEDVTQGIVCRPVPSEFRMVERDPARTLKVLKAWDSAKELLSHYPDGIRSTQYAPDWKDWTAKENF